MNESGGLNMEKFKKLYQKGLVQWVSISFILTLVIETLSKRSLIKTIIFLCTNPLIFLFNMLIIMVPIGISFFFKRRYFVMGLISALLLVLGVTDFVLLSNRVTPFVPADFLNIADALKVMTSYISVVQIILIICGFAIVIAALVVMFIKVPKVPHGIPVYKKVFAWIAMIFVVLIYNEVARMSGMIPKIFTNIADAYQKYGFTVCFSYGLFDTGISKPSNYDDGVVGTIVEEVEAEIEAEIEAEQTINETIVEEGDASTTAGTSSSTSDGNKKNEGSPNIIFIQLESFYDLTEMTNFTCSEDPIPYFHEMMDEYTSGYLTVPVIGAGTANTEFEVITGMNLDFFGPGEYPYKTVLKTTTCESMAYDMKNLGYSTHTIHNNTATFYSRNTVFPQLGFDTFTSSEYMENVTYNENGWIKDEVLIQQIMDAMHYSDDPDLIYTISVQGHGSYPTENILDQTVITIDGIEDDGLRNQFTYYANQIHQMDQFIKDLTDALSKFDEECVLVLYGDHLPTLGIEESMTGGKSLFETPLLIWDNIGLEREEINVEAYQLSAYVFGRIGVHEGVITKLHQAYFAGLSEENGKEYLTTTVTELPQEGTTKAEYLERLEILEYDLLYGDVEAYGGVNPYTATNMRLGVNDIKIKNASYADGVMYVKGEHFTPSSVVVVNGEMKDTEFSSSNMLLVRDFVPEDGQEIYVAQYASKDKESLSQTDSFHIKTSLNIRLENADDQ